MIPRNQFLTAIEKLLEESELKEKDFQGYEVAPTINLGDTFAELVLVDETTYRIEQRKFEESRRAPPNIVGAR